MFDPYDQRTGDYNSSARIFVTVLICSGVITASTLPPIIAQYNLSLTILKILASIMGLCYLTLIWVSSSQYIIVAFFIAALLGGAFFSFIPITLEYLVDINHPIAPESTSSLCWAIALFLGAWFTFITELLAVDKAADPPYNIKK
jgi:FLVCR family MFS transporter 7